VCFYSYPMTSDLFSTAILMSKALVSENKGSDPLEKERGEVGTG